MDLLFATRNTGKLRELVALIDLPGVCVVGLDAFPDAPEVEETGATFAENATLKAVAMMNATGLATLADDSGIEVDALGGRPGVHSARFGGPGLDDDGRNAHLIAQVSGVPRDRRTARYRCVLGFVDPRAPDRVELTEGACEGRIVDAPRGDGGFGYDPHFFFDELGQTFAEVHADVKHRFSHRGIAMRAMVPVIRARLAG